MLGGSNSEPDLSEEYILECTTQAFPKYPSTCSGGYLDPAIQLAVMNGMPSEKEFPYRATETSNGVPYTPGICQTKDLVKDTTLNGKYVGGYANITSDQMKTLLTYGPVAVSIYAP
jgi:hypothetical protein